ERIVTISDDLDEIISALREAEERADLVLITGGLGPTKDDVTKKALAQYFDCGFTFHPDIAEHIARLFARFGKEITEINRLQAELPSACEPLQNDQGTAPGMWFEKNRTVFVSMPGVPYEMKGIMMNHVFPRVRAKFNTPIILHRTILTMGMGESWLSEKIEEWESSLPSGFKLAYLPSPGRVRLRISAYGNQSDRLESLLESEVQKLLSIIPELVYGFDNETIESVVGQLLRSAGQTVATAESCTGGLIAHKITSVTGASDYFLGSIVSYSNEVKVNSLGVSENVLKEFGAVSEQVVRQMAEGVRKQLKTDFGIATSGIAGPDGGTDEKPVGTVWIAVSGPSKTIAKRFQFGHNRGRNIEISANTALNMLRKELIQ
ncbi:MAG: CinA family nicotinamide mononucleotide deamidase-related protein, partial [Flavobacteriales bacterium]|nr:CinA family nicotinamide mononucleotide deamidase-related protein [Flavobacteriales bacterium]